MNVLRDLRGTELTRIASQTDMSAQLGPEQAMAFGLPSLPNNEIPQCGVTGLLRTCTRNGKRSQYMRRS
jgi:hypothetical protein